MFVGPDPHTFCAGFQPWHPIDDRMNHGNAHGTKEGLNELTPELMKETLENMNMVMNAGENCCM